ncbi:MAG: anti-sigma factor family protein [Pirellula staleyi]
MKSPHPTVDELLSGMLDGVLSDDEVRQLEVAMSADPSVGKKLDELSRLRTGLLSGRNRSRLGPDFANKVLKLSQARAIEMGSECPAWLKSGQDKSARSHLKNPSVAGHTSTPRWVSPRWVSPRWVSPRWVSPRWVYGVVLTSAAVFCIVYASLPGRDEQRNFAEFSWQEDEAAKEAIEHSDNSRSLLSETQPDRDSHETAVPEVSAAKSSIFDSTAQSEASNATVPSIKQATSNFEINSLPENSSVAENSGSQADPNQNTAKLALDSSTQKWFTLVIDISIDKVAIENLALVSILKGHGVVYAEDLNINAEQLAALEDSQFIGRANAANAVESEKMGVMFIRAPLDKLGLAIDEIGDRYKDFPEFEMDLAYDSSVGLLIKQLSGIKAAEGKNGVVLNLSPPQSSKSSLPFTASVRKPGMFSRETLKKGTSKLFPESQEMGYVLLRFRAAR